MVIGQARLLAGAGIFGGVVGSMMVTRSLKTLLYNTSPYDPLTFGVISVAFLVTAAVSGWVPARRAAAIDPAVTLRAE